MATIQFFFRRALLLFAAFLQQILYLYSLYIAQIIGNIEFIINFECVVCMSTPVMIMTISISLGEYNTIVNAHALYGR